MSFTHCLNSGPESRFLAVFLGETPHDTIGQQDLLETIGMHDNIQGWFSSDTLPGLAPGLKCDRHRARHTAG